MQPIHVDAVLFVRFGVPVGSVVLGLFLGGLSGSAKWPSMHLTPHHAKLHEQIRALEGGEVQTATGRSKCLLELKKALAARQFYWEKVLEVDALNDNVRAYVHEDLAFNWDLVHMMVKFLERLREVETQLDNVQMVKSLEWVAADIFPNVPTP